jgi:exopolysaccharide biosynthesis predicted pyruvyltransferase EpsI
VLLNAGLANDYVQYQITSEQFQNITLSKAPDVLLAMADEPIGLTSSQKRLHKSLARSEKWLAALLQKNNVEVKCSFSARAITIHTKADIRSRIQNRTLLRYSHH